MNHYTSFYRVLCGISFVMTLISSITITFGLYPVLWLSFGSSIDFNLFLFILFLSFFIFGYLIDSKVPIISGFVTRQIYEKHFGVAGFIVLLIGFSIGSGFLTYSFLMSKDSATVSGISYLDGNAMYSGNEVVSDQFRAKEDSISMAIRDIYSRDFDRLNQAINTTKEQILIAQKLRDKRVRDSVVMSLNSILSNQNSSLVYLSGKVNEEVKLKVGSLSREWGKEEKMGDNKKRAGNFSNLVKKYANRFAFVSGWSIIIVCLCGVGKELILIDSKKTHIEHIRGSLLEVGYNIKRNLENNFVNVFRFLTKKTLVKEVSPPDFDPQQKGKKKLHP